MSLSAMSFKGNRAHTLGVELELQLVDAKTMELKSSVTQILEAMDALESDWIKPELMQCYMKINTGICHTVSDIRNDLAGKLAIQNEVLSSDGRSFLARISHTPLAFADFSD